ncbi:hypothetical protein [Nitrosopumilus sp.]|uniref:hypothetical protein n=1 Tax=Nitrosopumilus sp. TaxID=2024843 RepID=UPI002931B9D6|nr:hypothetical protein [Nitrosopumilus sp.]
MKVKCPNCSHKFTPSEDELCLDYDIDYDNDDRYVWEKLPILKSSFIITKNTKEEED